MHVNNKMLQAAQFGLPVVVVAQKLSYKLGLGLFQRHVIGITAKDVFELALELVDVVIGLSSELELNFFVLRLGPFLLFRTFVEIFTQVVDDSLEVMSVLLPKLTQ
jgi:hypothetical protein